MNTGSTPLQKLGAIGTNELYCKREDLYPFSFGGNKARKAELFFREIDRLGADCVVSYGSGESNHCRVVANHCAARAIDCFLITPEEASEKTFNSLLTARFGAERTVVPVEKVHDTIEETLKRLKDAGRKPYFIPGGGHGDLGTQAYVDCYREISDHEQQNNLFFDYIFLASGTGTTQAGLICGQLLRGDFDRRIIGISIARKNPRGRDVVLESVKSYLGDRLTSPELAEKMTVFLDDYAIGYGASDGRIRETIEDVMRRYGLPTDETYTGKAFYGMCEYLKKEHISGKKILFIHTGGTPLYFDHLVKTSSR